MTRYDVLVVDDNESRRQWTVRVLEAMPCSVLAVSSAHEGLRHLRTDCPTAVVVCEHLRGMSLTRFQAVLRKRYPEIPVVVTSFSWPVGRNVPTMSPGAYHCLLFCAQDREAALLTAVKKALNAPREQYVNKKLPLIADARRRTVASVCNEQGGVS